MYRDDYQAAMMLWRERVDDARSADPAVQQVLHRRIGRVCFGVVGLSAAAALVVYGLTADHQRDSPLALLLIGSWLLSSVAMLVGRQLSARHLRRLGARRQAVTGEPFGDFARRRIDPTPALVTRAQRLGRVAFALPLVAACLLAPLSLHALISLAQGGGREFVKWMGLSTMLVGHCHVVLALLAWRFVNQLQQDLEAGVAPPLWSRFFRIYGLVVLSSLVPGVLVFGISTAIVAVTGLIVGPPLFWITWSRAIAEHAALGSATREDCGCDVGDSRRGAPPCPGD